MLAVIAILGMLTNPCDDQSAERDSVWYAAVRPHVLTLGPQPDTIAVAARGWAADSLCITLQIRGRSRVLYERRWASGAYFFYGARPRSEMWEEVRSALQKLTAPGAVRPLAPESLDPDGAREAIAWDLYGEATLDSLEASGLTDEALFRRTDSLLAARATGHKIRDAWDAIVAQNPPTFAYSTGGEWGFRITWSERLQRFVQIFSCC